MESFVEDLRAAHNATGNETTPFNEQEAIHKYIEGLFRGENLPGFSRVIHGVLMALMFLLIPAIRYTMWQILATLAIVEEPQMTFEKDIKRDQGSIEDDESSAVSTTMITSRIRSTLKHLYKVGGVTAFWRGTAITIAYYIVGFAILGIIHGFIEFFLKPESRIVKTIIDVLVKILAGFVLANWDTAFTHIIITKPTSRVWFQRFPSIRTFKHIWQPTLFYEIASHLTFDSQIWLMRAFNLNKMERVYMNPESTPRQMFIFWIIWLVAQAFRVGLLVPCGVALVRVQASLLPDDEETIVPVNKNFDKRLAPGIFSSPRIITFKEAWKSFDRLDKHRIYTLYAKFILIEFLVHGVFSIGLGKEAWPDLKYLNPSIPF